MIITMITHRNKGNNLKIQSVQNYLCRMFFYVFVCVFHSTIIYLTFLFFLHNSIFSVVCFLFRIQFLYPFYQFILIEIFPSECCGILSFGFGIFVFIRNDVVLSVSKCEPTKRKRISLERRKVSRFQMNWTFSHFRFFINSIFNFCSSFFQLSFFRFSDQGSTNLFETIVDSLQILPFKSTHDHSIHLISVIFDFYKFIASKVKMTKKQMHCHTIANN